MLDNLPPLNQLSPAEALKMAALILMLDNLLLLNQQSPAEALKMAALILMLDNLPPLNQLRPAEALKMAALMTPMESPRKYQGSIQTSKVPKTSIQDSKASMIRTGNAGQHASTEPAKASKGPEDGSPNSTIQMIVMTVRMDDL
ncbi:hypothetical protein UPYG_G00355080 [Umbra pygmaea]|uniref:Uncharacterized protein n=1 Tax=Umbra pygmaea TaxID=75934 RepID=A0ABD0WG55_UMBPY